MTNVTHAQFSYKNNSLLAELNHVITRFIIDLYHNGDFDALEQFGISKSTAKELSGLSINNHHRLTKCQQLLCNVFIDERRLKRLMQYIIHNETKDSFIDELIMMQASQPMLERLAGVDHHDFRQRRNLLDLPKAAAGRPAVLTDKEAIRVAESWQRHADKEHDLLQRYFYVGMDTGIPLSRLWNHMQLSGYDCNNVIKPGMHSNCQGI